MLESQSPYSLSVAVSHLQEQAEFFAARRDVARARPLCEAAMQLDETLYSRIAWGEFLFQWGDYLEAVAEFRAIWDIAKRDQAVRWQALACRHLAVIYRETGQTVLARSFQQQELSIRTRNPGSFSEDNAPLDWAGLANDALLQGNLDEAEQFIRRVLERPPQESRSTDVADAWGTLGAVRLLQKQPRGAFWCFRRAYGLHCRTRDGRGMLADLMNLAHVSRQQGGWELAARLLQTARKRAEELGASPPLNRTIEQLLRETEQVLGVARRTPQWN